VLAEAGHLPPDDVDRGLIAALDRSWHVNQPAGFPFEGS
jgi:hypothetical protein